MTGWPQITFDVERGYSRCFGCGQDNPIGLKLKFQPDGHTARAEFCPDEAYQGWPGLVHGGIIMCLLDEAMGWAVLFQGLNCLTAEMEVKLRRPAAINESLVVTGHITRKTRKLIEAKATVALADGTLIAEGKSKNFVVNSAHWREKSADNDGK